MNTNSITPILKRMEAQGIITRQYSEEDERKVIITLTPKGKMLQIEAASIPEKFVAGLVSSNAKNGRTANFKDQGVPYST